MRRIRRDRELTTGALSRRLAELGHPIAATGITKIEKGQRGIDVDDLVALAAALKTTPNRLLLPDIEGGVPYEGEPAPWGKEPPARLWAWALGEVPLGRRPALATDDRKSRGEEVVFGRENRQHLWNPPSATAPSSGEQAAARVFAVTGLAAFIQAAFAAGLTTAEIRGAVEGAVVTALINPGAATASPQIEVTEGRVTVWTNPPDFPAAQAQETQ
jgi:transcriptional regulator with XRE-family HTH domain